MNCEKKMSSFLLLFDKHFSNYLQIPAKRSNNMFSMCQIFLKKNAKSR